MIAVESTHGSYGTGSRWHPHCRRSIPTLSSFCFVMWLGPWYLVRAVADSIDVALAIPPSVAAAGDAVDAEHEGGGAERDFALVGEVPGFFERRG